MGERYTSDGRVNDPQLFRLVNSTSSLTVFPFNSPFSLRFSAVLLLRFRPLFRSIRELFWMFLGEVSAAVLERFLGEFRAMGRSVLVCTWGYMEC